MLTYRCTYTMHNTLTGFFLNPNSVVFISQEALGICAVKNIIMAIFQRYLETRFNNHGFFKAQPVASIDFWVLWVKPGF